MFDFHIHSTVSFDGHDTPEAMARAALERRLQEICFTDHIDYMENDDTMVFDFDHYSRAYDHLEMPGLKIRRGVEFGITPDNPWQLAKDLTRREFDFVIGSVHCVDGVDVYLAPYWEGKTTEEAYAIHLEETYRAVCAHRDFDVLGHLTFVSKCRGNPNKVPVDYQRHRQIVDAILEELAKKDKGLEINTSGVDRCGAYLPSEVFLRRFKELGGRIVTVGSDAHNVERVGQYSREACALLKDIFGYVCTFENRQPIFHKL